MEQANTIKAGGRIAAVNTKRGFQELHRGMRKLFADHDPGTG